LSPEKAAQSGGCLWGCKRCVISTNKRSMPDKIPVERSRGLRLWAFYPAGLARFDDIKAHF
jgi:hypothetical protein